MASTGELGRSMLRPYKRKSLAFTREAGSMEGAVRREFAQSERQLPGQEFGGEQGEQPSRV